LIERFLAKFSTNLIAVGSQVKDDLIHARIGTNEKFRVIGPGLSLNNLPARSRVEEKFEIPSSKFHVSWVGRAVSIKAPHRILEIAQECKRMRIDVDFLIVGDGPLLNELKKAANLSSLSIRFLGWQSEIEPILSITDLMILTSLNEGTPVSLIQAQLAGIPVLTTDVGSASEVLIDGKSGFCLEYSPVSFAMKIEELFSNDQLSKEMGESAKTFAMSKFSVERLVGDHTALYLNVINQSNF
jgi:glycosyltransferase involved in cell wall biosynthesis